MPIVQTKAKLNSTLSRTPTREFGKDPMFESSRWANIYLPCSIPLISCATRQRQTFDEDAPPTASVNDILNTTYTDGPSYHQRSVGAYAPLPVCGL
jgi:nuclear pore complex protein Nup53